MNPDKLTEEIIGSAIEVHRQFGPGILESSYKKCLCHELSLRQIPFECEKALPLSYKGLLRDVGYRIDLLVGGLVVVELKVVEKLLPIHEAQLLTYLTLGNWPIGLLINFNVEVLRLGIKRMVSSYQSASAPSAPLR